MDQLSYHLKTILSKTCIAALGRRNAVRLARFVLNEARLDPPNQMSLNGERKLQSDFVHATRDRSTVVFDIGANVGDWSQSLLQQVGAPGVRVHAFEPAPETADTLRRRLGSSAAVTVHQIALSDRIGEAHLHVPGQNAGTSSLVPQARDLGGAEHNVAVSLSTVDDFCTRTEIERIDFGKCDVEGHDLAVLRGAERMFAQGRVGLWQFEYNWRWISARAFLRDVFEFAQKHGYELGKVTGRGIEFYRSWDPELETFVENNYVLCDASWAKRLPRVSWWKDVAA